MPDSPEPAPLAPASVAALQDFPDRLPAVLVKELRQGLRGRMFVVPFLILQGLLILTNVEPGRGATLNFWHFIILVLILLLPSRSLGALSEERDANTLDTLVLTRLTPWRIVWGKWCAAAAQSSLTAVAIVPHLLVRYLNGGTRFIQEGMLLLALLLLSGAVAGVFTAFSVIKSQLARNGLAVAVMAGVYGWICLPLVLQPYVDDNEFSPAVLWEVMILSAWAALFCLWHAAASIAPAAANLTTPRRLTSFAAVLILSWIATAASPAGDSIFAYGLLGMLGVVSMVEMGEHLSLHPGIAAAFKRHTVAGLLFRPGWNSGVLFCAVLWSLAGVISGLGREPFFLAAASLCFFPVTARLLFPAQRRLGVAPMVLLVVASHTLKMLILSIDRSSESPAAYIPGLFDQRLPLETFHPPLVLGWIGLALLQATGTLVYHSRRVRE